MATNECNCTESVCICVPSDEPIGITGLAYNLDPNSWVLQLNLAVGESREANGIRIERVDEINYSLTTI